MPWGKRIIGLLLISILIGAAIPILPVEHVAGDLSNPTVLQTHNTISITNNSQFNTSNGVVGGNGTVGNPHIIENLSIDTRGSNGISIQNTNVFFVINNCHIYNGSTFSSGIFLHNVKNGIIENNRIESNYYGIYLFSISPHKITCNILIHNNTIFNNSNVGVLLYYSNNITIWNNVIYNNGKNFNSYGGIYLRFSNLNKLINNIVYNNTEQGIAFYSSKNNALFNNTIYDNKYNFYITSSIYLIYMNHTISSNNTVNGKPIYYWINQSNLSVPLNTGYVGLINCYNITIKNLSLENNYQGILLHSTSNCSIVKNTISNTRYGIYFYSSSNNTIFNNICNDNFYAMSIHSYSKGNHIFKNKIFNNTDGINLFSNEVKNRIYQNIIFNNSNRGILISRVLELCSIYNNSIYNNSLGIQSWESEFCRIYNNTIFNNDVGLYLADSDKNTLFNNKIFNNTYNFRIGWGVNIYYNHTIYENNTVNGKPIYYWFKQSDKIVPLNAGFIALFECKNISVINSNISNNYMGVILYQSSNCNINNNILMRNYYGLFINSYMGSSTNLKISNNTISENSYGINLHTTNSLVYNNYLNNSNNLYYYDYNQNNKLNISRTIGPNIVGGPFLGGNYWSHYTGVDINGDGLGDTNVPIFLYGDYLPLCYNIVDIVSPTVIVNLTVLPTTGEQYTFNATIIDFGKVNDAYVEYWFNQDPSKNETMNRINGDDRNGTYFHNILVPNSTSKLNFYISSRDLTGNWNPLVQYVLNVIDNDKPELIDLSSTTSTTGDPFIINCSATDNVYVSAVHLEYWYNDDVHQNSTLGKIHDTYIFDMNVQSDAMEMTYRISATDNESNWVSTGNKSLVVEDNDAPTITDLSGVPYSGENYKFEIKIIDNVNLINKYLEYWFDDEIHENITLDDSYEHFCSIPDNAFILHGLVTAIDAVGNIKQLIINKEIIDNIPPMIEYLTEGKPKTGELFRINCSAWENQMLESVKIKHWINEIEEPRVPMIFENGYYTTDLYVPTHASKLRITVTVRDINDNTIHLDRSFDVVDIIPPKIQDLSEGEPTTGEDYIIKTTVDDNIKFKFLYIEYWFNNNKPINRSFHEEYQINIPTNARTFRYILSACDSSDNFGAISKLVDVVDNDAPIIIDPLLEPTTGDYLNLTIEYYDNVEVTIAKLEYGFHSDESTILDYFGNQSILVPTVATFFHYSFSIIDGNENDASISHEIPVVDNDEPIIIDNSSKTSDGYKFSVDVEDNIGIIEVKVDYWFDDVKVKFISLKLIDGIYQGTISIPKSAKNINYQISADDPSGNRGRLEKTDIILKQESDASDSAGLEIGTTEIFILLIIIIIVLVIVLFSFWRRKKRVEKVIHSESATIIKPHTRPQAIITSPQVPSAATVTIPQPRTDQQLYSQPTILKPSQLIPINVPPGPGTWPGDMAMVPAQPKNAQGPQIFTPPKPGSDEIYHEPSGGSVWEPTDEELKLEEAPDEDIATKEKIVEPQKSTDITTNSVSEERSLVKGEYEEKKNG